MNCEALLKEKFEIIVILEGTIESTGQSSKSRKPMIENYPKIIRFA